MSDRMVDEDFANKLRSVIADSFDHDVMVGTFIVIAENTDVDGEQSLLTWFDGGSGWQRLGMAEWFAERMRQEIETGEDDE